jgi:hypothetical protein
MDPIVDTVIAIETSDDLPSIQQTVRAAVGVPVSSKAASILLTYANI